MDRLIDYPYDEYLVDEVSATICILRDDRRLWQRVRRLVKWSQTYPAMNPDGTWAVQMIVVDIVTSRGLDPRCWRDHVYVVERAMDIITGVEPDASQS